MCRVLIKEVHDAYIDDDDDLMEDIQFSIGALSQPFLVDDDIIQYQPEGTDGFLQQDGTGTVTFTLPIQAATTGFPTPFEILQQFQGGSVEAIQQIQVVTVGSAPLNQAATQELHISSGGSAQQLQVGTSGSHPQTGEPGAAPEFEIVQHVTQVLTATMQQFEWFDDVMPFVPATN